MKFKRDYVYEIVKKKATRIEELPSPMPEEQKEVKITPYLNDTHPFWIIKKSAFNERKRTCVICGQTASYVAYFQIDKAQIVEKYCEHCLDKWVIIPNQSIPSPTLSK